jgi:hypothetical protein
VCSAFAHDFGRERIFQLSSQDEDDPDHKQVSATVRGRTLGEEGLDYYRIWDMYARGWRFKATRVDGEHNLEQILEDNRTGAEPTIFGAIRTDGQVQLRGAGDEDFALNDGDTVILFIKDHKRTVKGASLT